MVVGEPGQHGHLAQSPVMATSLASRQGWYLPHITFYLKLQNHNFIQV